MQCIYRRSQTDGRQIENRGDLFHVTHPPPPPLSFLPCFHLSFYSPRPSNTTTTLLSVCSIFSQFAVSPPSSLSVLSAGYQAKVKCMPLSALAFPWETGQTVPLMENRRKRTSALLLYPFLFVTFTFDKYSCNVQWLDLYNYTSCSHHPKHDGNSGGKISKYIHYKWKYDREQL